MIIALSLFHYFSILCKFLLMSCPKLLHQISNQITDASEQTPSSEISIEYNKIADIIIVTERFERVEKENG